MLCKHCAGGAVYRQCCAQVVHMVLVCMWYYVHGIHVVLCTCNTMYVHCVVMALTCVFNLLYIVYVYLLCYKYTPDVCVCIVLCCILGVDVCVVCQV